ncbi:hypothetical protein HYDPIDRAFT_32013 [Hydnomerulius pinastri MD-312]|uniref:Uncharacterized protein n=1 Tax=Hydnomerulius pinastri MD-312 TaxID=994086 RepID=A0A0C9W374_9AGAM|nr:hypothetical protein HYDPIDRAFT_32013 [Hydnomerulius pinastri MD-312]
MARPRRRVQAHQPDENSNSAGTANEHELSSNERQTLQDKVNEQQQQLLLLQEELEKTRTAQQAAESRAQTSQHSGREPPVLIPKPKGQAGEKGFNLQDEMKLEDEKELYLAILRDVRALCFAAQLDYKIDYRHQPPKDLGNIFDVAKRHHPYLEQFHNNWATSEIVKQFLRNRRKYAARMCHDQVRGGRPATPMRSTSNPAGRRASVPTPAHNNAGGQPTANTV